VQGVQKAIEEQKHYIDYRMKPLEIGKIGCFGLVIENLSSQELKADEKAVGFFHALYSGVDKDLSSISPYWPILHNSGIYTVNTNIPGVPVAHLCAHLLRQNIEIQKIKIFSSQTKEVLARELEVKTFGADGHMVQLYIPLKAKRGQKHKNVVEAETSFTLTNLSALAIDELKPKEQLTIIFYTKDYKQFL
jgi:hypothetical protein